MNAAGHIAVAARLDLGGGPTGPGPTEPALLGAALPDLAAMGRFRLRGAEAHPDGALGWGIRVHHRTDEAFHRHPWFTERNRALYHQLHQQGFDRGPARACSHVGTELLLDGELLADTGVARAVSEAFEAIPGLASELAPLVRAPDPGPWLEHLARFSAHRLPTDYHRPEAVAHRLQRILAGRARLSFSPTLIPALTDALAHHQPTVAATAAPLIEELAHQVSGRLRFPPAPTAI